jgi:hypothetical protein
MRKIAGSNSDPAYREAYEKKKAKGLEGEALTKSIAEIEVRKR